jgi:hypothetical protein
MINTMEGNAMISTFIRAMLGMSFPKNSGGAALTTAEQRVLNIGAILSGTRLEYTNSLETSKNAKSSKRERDSLERQWGIGSTETALKTLDWLKEEGHRMQFDPILKCATDALSPDSEYEYHWPTVSNLEDALPLLRSRGYVRGAPLYLPLLECISDLDLEDKSTLAWDMGRMVNVARWSYELGYITESEAWAYIFHAEAESASFYEDWAGFGNAYIIGRSMWGDNNMLSVHIDMVEKLLKDPKSPWAFMPLR